MSDTPRTDAARGTSHSANYENLVPAEFAMELERELAAAKKEIAEGVAIMSPLLGRVQRVVELHTAGEIMPRTTAGCDALIALKE